jgi:hypothetical protein
MGQGFHITHPARRGKTGISNGRKILTGFVPTIGKSIGSGLKNSGHRKVLL